MITSLIIESPLGKIILKAQKDQLTCCQFLQRQKNCFEQQTTPFLLNVQKQLDEYFSGQRKNFDIPLNLLGTPFQIKVWQALQTIPYGETQSYKYIAKKINNPHAYRAVGMANNKNPLAIIIPCHRVIGTNGKLTGYAGGVDLKQKLLQLEQKYK